MKKHLFFIFAGLLFASFLKAQCSANFTYTVSANTVSVTAVSTGTGTALYTWQWGETLSLPGSGQSATYTYSTSGTYSLCLTYIEIGFPPCSTQVCQNIVIGSVGIKEQINVEDYFRISPNPAKTFVNLDYSVSKLSKCSISLLDITGKVIDFVELEKELQMGSYNRRYSLENLSAGIYFIRFKTDNGIETKKLIVD
jgi:hypothetical protein